jgi:hypothetical protein
VLDDVAARDLTSALEEGVDGGHVRQLARVARVLRHDEVPEVWVALGRLRVPAVLGLALEVSPTGAVVRVLEVQVVVRMYIVGIGGGRALQGEASADGHEAGDQHGHRYLALADASHPDLPLCGCRRGRFRALLPRSLRDQKFP